MKSIVTHLILLFISTFCFSQSRVFQEVSVIGNKVNIRTEPNLNCKIAYQKNWGDTFQGTRYNDEWYELIDENNNILYGYHKYIKVVEKAPSQALSSTIQSTTDHSQIPVANVLKSDPHVLYQSKSYTLNDKPSHLPRTTVTTSSTKVLTHPRKTTIPIAKTLAKKTAVPIQTDLKEIDVQPIPEPVVEYKTVLVKITRKEVEKPEKVKLVSETVEKETVAAAKTETTLKETIVKSIPEPIVEQKVVLAKTTAKQIEKPKEVKLVAETVAKKEIAAAKKISNQNTVRDQEFEHESVEAKEVRLLLEQLNAYIELKNMIKARSITLELINNHVDESLETADGVCILVGEKAYHTFFDMLPNSNFRSQELRRLVNDVFDPLLVNLIRLDIVDHWIREDKYQYALDIMDNIMTHNSESLTLPKHCENDPNLKSSPQIELKNKYFLVYHLLDDEKKKEILAKLKKLKKAKNSVTKNIARDIHAKISGDFWEKN